MMMHRLANFKL